MPPTNWVRELEAWSTPGKLLPANYGRELQAAMEIAGIPPGIVLGLEDLPNPADAEWVIDAVVSGTLQQSEVEAFLAGHPPFRSSDAAASAFLEHREGRCLAWIHLPVSGPGIIRPTGEARDLLLRISAILAARGHLLIDPDDGLPFLP